MGEGMRRLTGSSEPVLRKYSEKLTLPHQCVSQEVYNKEIGGLQLRRGGRIAAPSFSFKCTRLSSDRKPRVSRQRSVPPTVPRNPSWNCGRGRATRGRRDRPGRASARRGR